MFLIGKQTKQYEKKEKKMVFNMQMIAYKSMYIESLECRK